MSPLPDKPGAYIEVALAVPNDLCEVVCDFIIEHLSNGLILEEEEDSPRTGIRFYLAEDDQRDFESLLTEHLKALTGDGMPQAPEIKHRIVRSAEWEEQYRLSVKPVLVDDICIRPPWETCPKDSRVDLVVEPRMAFGTGQHESTRSCLRIIRRNLRTGARFLDLGCGSGILSILADKLGAARIKAIDYDIIAVENCLDNFEINQVKAERDVLLGSIDRCHGDPTYDFVCVNIIKETILDMLPRLKELTAGGGTIALAGLLQRDEGDISTALTEIGLTRFEIMTDNDWIAYTVFRD